MAASKPAKKVAIVHDWLYGGGAERVVLELHKMFPDAPIYTSYCSDEWRQKLDGKVITGYLQRWPFNKLRKFLPVLRARWFESLDLTSYDLVISSSGNGEAKSVRAGSRYVESQQHVLYCHSPTHFYWRHYNMYLERPGFGKLDRLARFGLKLLIKPLRKRDYEAAQRPDRIIANSTHIQADIKRYYGRDSEVIFPPVDVERFTSLPTVKRKGFVTVSRQVPQKHVDIIVQACTQLNLPLTVVGKGPEHDSLVKIAGPSVTFVTDANDQQVATALASAEAFIFAALDDFGITPIEAMAAGTPVIAYKAGGALDYVQPGVTGEFFDGQDVASLATALRKFNYASFDTILIRQKALEFSTISYHNKMSTFLNNTIVT